MSDVSERGDLPATHGDAPTTPSEATTQSEATTRSEATAQSEATTQSEPTSSEAIPATRTEERRALARARRFWPLLVVVIVVAVLLLSSHHAPVEVHVEYVLIGARADVEELSVRWRGRESGKELAATFRFDAGVAPRVHDQVVELAPDTYDVQVTLTRVDGSSASIEREIVLDRETSNVSIRFHE